MLKELKQMVTELNTTNSTNEKKEILKKYPNMQNILKWVYNPYTKFWVTSKILKKRKDLVGDNVYQDIEMLLDALNNREITGHAAISAVNSFIEENKEYEDIIYTIIDKNLKTRTDAKLINSIYPNLIPTFDCALANKYEDYAHKIDFEKDDWYASRKLDGCVIYDTIVEFEDGNKIKIGKVVEDKILGKIKSYNTKTKTIEYKEIKDWMKNGIDINDDNHEWYEIELENNEKIILTGNHRIWCDNLRCWRRTDELDGSEILLVS